MWLRYVDDKFVIQKEDNKQSFLEQINSVDPAIKFTVEDNKEDGAIPFLDPVSNQKPMVDCLSQYIGSLPTQINIYNATVTITYQPKYSVINTLTHGAKTVCNKPGLLQKEIDHLRKALTYCKSPKWALDRMGRRLTKPTSEESNDANNQGTTCTKPTNNEVKIKGHIVIPYTQGLCKSIKKICSKYGIQTNFKGKSTIKTWFPPKDKDLMENKSGVIYWFQSGDLMCDEEYIGKTFRTFIERFKEHLKEPSPIHNHSQSTGHTTTEDNFQIIGREVHAIARTIKESIYIMVNNPTLNGNIGNFNLHHILDRVLLNTPGLKIKRHCLSM